MYDDYYEPPDSPMDESVTLRCPNPECWMYFDPEGPEIGETWHPTTFSEYQGAPPHGGMVSFYDEDSWLCEECVTEGVEL